MRVAENISSAFFIVSVILSTPLNNNNFSHNFLTIFTFLLLLQHHGINLFVIIFVNEAIRRVL